MDKVLFIIPSFLFLFFQSEKALASHAVGADLTYQCLGGNNYRFFFTLYRDCQGIAVNPSYTIVGTSTCGGNVNITVLMDSTVEIVHTCPSVDTKCVNSMSPIMGIQANYFHGDITLQDTCNVWTFGINPIICNRNVAITNIQWPASYCLYVEAKLNNQAVLCDNSPAFSTLPSPFLCFGTDQIYAVHSTDLDNDSLFFEMYTPHSDSTTNVSYINGMTALQPVTYTLAADSTQFNSTNGEIRFLANAPQITVVAVRISEFRNGVFIGSVERDIELIFESCASLPNPPVASGINGTPVFTAHVCYDSLLSFQIFTNDLDTDSTFISWDHAIPGGILTTIPGVFQSGIFSWYPDSSNISSNPYSFTLTVSDNSCPVSFSNNYQFRIYVDSCQATTSTADKENPIRFFTAGYSLESHSIHFKYMLGDEQGVSISLFDLTGRELKKIFLEKSIGKEGDFLLPEFTAGLYIINLRTGDGISKSMKLVVE